MFFSQSKSYWLAPDYCDRPKTKRGIFKNWAWWQSSCTTRFDCFLLPVKNGGLARFCETVREEFYFKVAMEMTCSDSKDAIDPDKPGLDLIARPFKSWIIKRKKVLSSTKTHPLILPRFLFWPSSTHAIRHLGSVIWICVFRFCQQVVGRNEGFFFFW